MSDAGVERAFHILGRELRKVDPGAFDRVAVAQLTHLLGQAGCADRRLLGHLGAGAHHRGCWALDWLLGRDGAICAEEVAVG